MILNKNVKCIKRDAVDITVGIIYHVIAEGQFWYEIRNDNGKTWKYAKTDFEEVKISE